MCIMPSSLNNLNRDALSAIAVRFYSMYFVWSIAKAIGTFGRIDWFTAMRNFYIKSLGQKPEYILSLKACKYHVPFAT